MKYLLEGVILVGSIGAYRVYTDRRKSVMHGTWDAYRHLWLGMSRRSGDCVASIIHDGVCLYPNEARSLFKNLHENCGVSKEALARYRSALLYRAARYRVWETSGKLSYMQRLGRVNMETPSIFESPHTWKKQVTFSSPPDLLKHVKSGPTRNYLNALSLVRDGFLGVLEGTPSDIISLMTTISEKKRDLAQDIRNGHVLDRLPQVSVPMVHELRLEFETYLFGQTGPDPERSSYIEKVFAAGEPQLLEKLFPFMECIVDDSMQETRNKQTKDDLNKLKVLAPNVPVITPSLKIAAADGQECIVGRLRQNVLNEYIIDPLVMEGLHFNGQLSADKDVLTPGQKCSLTLTNNKDENHLLNVTIVEITPTGIPIVRVD